MTGDSSSTDLKKPQLPEPIDQPATDQPSRSKVLSPEAERALAEAKARREAAVNRAPDGAKEFQGPKGPEPTRYGDWENKGIASDF